MTDGAETRPVGRPSDFTQDIADHICGELADGRSLRQICREDAGMPNRGTVLRWLADERYGTFRNQYARARDAQADALVEECLEIADDGSNDWMARNTDGDAGYAVNGEHVQRSKLRCDQRKWWAARIAPKKYGDKSAVELTGADGGPIQSISLDPERLKSMSESELAALESAIGKLQRGAGGDTAGAVVPASGADYSGTLHDGEGELAT